MGAGQTGKADHDISGPPERGAELETESDQGAIIQSMSLGKAVDIKAGWPHVYAGRVKWP